MFLDALHDCLSKTGINLQIQFTKVGHSREIDLILASYDKKKWIIIDDQDDFLFKKT
jgi:hypothetical protein